MTGFHLLSSAEDDDEEEYTALVRLKTKCFADLGPVLDAIEALVRLAPEVTGEVESPDQQYVRTFYGWDKNVWRPE